VWVCAFASEVSVLEIALGYIAEIFCNREEVGVQRHGGLVEEGQ